MSPRSRSILVRAWDLTKQLGGLGAVVTALILLVRIADGVHDLNATVTAVVKDQRAIERTVASLAADVGADRRDLNRHEALLERVLQARAVAR